MPKEVFEFACPCCGKRIELNTRNGKARAVRIEETKRGKSFDDLVDAQKRDGDRLESMFDEAAKDHASQDEVLDAKFKDAKKAAKDDRDKPPHPFLQD